MALQTFGVKYKRAHTACIEFKTDIDSEYTAHEQRNALWTNPRKSWVLEFEKTPENFSAMESFFIAHRGRWKAFNFVYNGVTYTVRFDIDKLDFKVDELGYKYFSVPIVEVMTNE